MIGQRLLADARAAGMSIEVEGTDLIIEADRDPPPALLDELRQHKAEVIAVLLPQREPAVAVSQDVDDLAERVALVECGANVPRRWAEGYAALSMMPAPTGFSLEHWQRIVDAAGVFVDKWAAKASACGWSDIDAFGCSPDRPDRRFDAMGLVLLLDRWEVAGLDECGADLATETAGSLLRFRRRPMPADTVPLWDFVTRPGAALTPPASYGAAKGYRDD